MNKAEIEHLELLAAVDELVERLGNWAEPVSPWEPMNRARALVRRLLERMGTLRVRLEAPIIIATFGGTGTGKSSLVNALVGTDCTIVGRQRPTTLRPVLVAHPQTEIDALELPLDDFEIVRVDATLLRDIVIVDCPDPDTSEMDSPGSNLERLHQLLPLCDVLIYTSTQQKYRSARVADELGQAATGCRLLFVQTHADTDSDIRDDWRKQLSAHYEVPELFFVDSLRALKEQSANRRPSGDFGRLQDLLLSELAASERIHIRRANLIDLIHTALERCRNDLAGNWQPVEQLEAALEEQRRKLTAAMSERLGDELMKSRGLWERRLIDSVTQIWGFSPFSSLLRFHNGIGSLIASFGLFRARNSAQLALIGALQGARWLKSRKTERESENRLEQIADFGLEEEKLRETQFVISGYVKSARLDPQLVESESPEHLREEAALVEDRFLEDAGRRIDFVIDGLAENNARWYVRVCYEVMFLAYVVFVLYRVGINFFYETFIHSVDFLTIEFYIASGVFFVLWSAVLVMSFTGRMRKGLRGKIRALAAELAQSRMSRGLFPKLEQSCRDIALSRVRLDAMSERAAELRRQLAGSKTFGSTKAGVEQAADARLGD